MRLVLLMVAALMPLFLLSLGGAILLSNDAENRAEQGLEFIASLVAASQQRVSDSARQILTSIANNPALLTGDIAACDAYFTRLVEQLPMYANIGIIQPDGYIRCHGLQASKPIYVGDRPYFDAAKSAGEFVAGGYLLARVTGKPIITFALPVRSGPGQEAAVVFAAMYVSSFSREINQVQLPAGRRLFIQDRNAVVLAANPDTGAVVGKILADLADAATLRTAGARIYKDTDRNGQSRINAFMPGDKTANPATFISVRVDRDEVVAPARQQLALTLLALTLVSVFGGWLAWRMGERTIVGPTSSILRVTSEIRNGQLGTRVPVADMSKGSEFGRIAQALNQMADVMEQRELDLARELAQAKQANAKLEQLQVVQTQSVMQLHQAGERYAALFETAPVPMWIYDAKSYMILTINSTALSKYGYSAEEFKAMHIFELRAPTDMRPFLSAASPGDEHQGIRQHIRKDGTTFSANVVTKPIFYEGRPARFVVIVDLTDQVNAERQVEHYLEMLERAASAAQAVTRHQTLRGMMNELATQARSVVGAHQAAICLQLPGSDVPTITVQSVSEKLTSYRGMPQAPSILALVARTQERNQTVSLTQAALEAHPIWRGTEQTSESYLPMRGWLAVPLINHDGQNIGLLQLSDKYEGDFTLQDEYVALGLAQIASIAIENAQLLEQVNQLNTGLEKKVAERTDSLRLVNQELEAFSYSVSHDLRAPLNTIDGFSRLLSKQVQQAVDLKGQHYLARIQSGVAQMGMLIEDLLSLAQVSRTELRREMLDLSALGERIVDDWRGRDPHRQVNVEIERGLQARGDERLVKLVLENLLGNAWKFTSQRADAHIHFGKQVDADGYDVFFVADNGAGFDMAYADKLFVAFQRLHGVSEFGGSGIGLATVSRAIGRHGGRVWADAAPGKGATFFFSLRDAIGT